MARGAYQRQLTNPPRETIRFLRRHPLRLLEVAAAAAGVWVVCWLLAHLTPLHWLGDAGLPLAAGAAGTRTFVVRNPDWWGSGARRSRGAKREAGEKAL
jgi:hypothetical protein